MPATVTDYRAVPAALRGRPQWLVWRYERKPDSDKPTKVPYQARGDRLKASSTEPRTWATFEEAVAYQETHTWVNGIGFALSPDDPFVGIDLDNCRNPETGILAPWAYEIVTHFQSYTEVSPSQAGLRIFLRGALDGRGRKHGDLEVYDQGRYLTVTGRHLTGTPATVEDRGARLVAWVHDVFPSQEQRNGTAHGPGIPNDLDDRQLIAKAKASANGVKFARLWAGDWSDYPSASSADLALCSMLAFWTGGDADRVDRLFRDCGLYRAKWDERRGQTTYGWLTIMLAVNTASTYYHPPSPPLSVPPRETTARAEESPAEVSGDFELTDMGNARRLVARYGHALRYCHLWSKWLVWDGARWRMDDTGAVMRCAKTTVRSIYDEAAAAGDGDQAKAVAKHAIRSQGEARVRAMVALAESELGVPVTPDHLDADPWLLCLQNGTLDLRTGQMREHQREDLITRVAPVAYDPNALCPVWETFLVSIMGGNDRLVEFLQRAAGYSLTGDTRERVLFFLHGIGANGKSTFIEALRSLLGDYALRTPTETLLAKNDGGIPNDVARLKGARYVSTSETEEGKRLAEALVKALTGGDTVSARFMRGEWFDFRPEFKLWLATNHKPVIRGTDHGIWDRICLIPFDIRIPDDEQDKDLPRKLLAELPGILAWAVRGCLFWQQEGIGTPDEVKTATDSYRAEMDVLGGFLQDRCEEGPTYTISSGQLYATYKQWAESSNEYAASQRVFSNRLSERGFRPTKGTGGVRQWLGLRLRPSTSGGV